jgi:uncharacterized phiE125 gp8 family phage protein
MTPPSRVTPPAEDLIALAAMKEHLRVTFDSDDAVIAGLIAAATAHLDGYDGILGRCMVTQSWAVRLTAWPFWGLRLPFPNVQSVVIGYIDADEAPQTVPVEQYDLVETHLGTEMVFKDSFAAPALSDDDTLPVTITMTVGYGDAADVPQPLVLAAKVLVAHWYENRGITGDPERLPFAFDALVAPFRRVWL